VLIHLFRYFVWHQYNVFIQLYIYSMLSDMFNMCYLLHMWQLLSYSIWHMFIQLLSYSIWHMFIVHSVAEIQCLTCVHSLVQIWCLIHTLSDCSDFYICYRTHISKDYIPLKHARTIQLELSCFCTKPFNFLASYIRKSGCSVLKMNIGLRCCEALIIDLFRIYIFFHK